MIMYFDMVIDLMRWVTFMARLCDSTLRNIQPSGFSGCYSIMRTRGGRVYMYSIYVQISVGVQSVQIAVMGVQ